MPTVCHGLIHLIWGISITYLNISNFIHHTSYPMTRHFSNFYHMLLSSLQCTHLYIVGDVSKMLLLNSSFFLINELFEEQFPNMQCKQLPNFPIMCCGQTVGAEMGQVTPFLLTRKWKYVFGILSFHSIFHAHDLR